MENGIYPTEPMTEQGVRDDLAFLSAAGQVEVDPETVDVSRFWDYRPDRGGRRQLTPRTAVRRRPGRRTAPASPHRGVATGMTSAQTTRADIDAGGGARVPGLAARLGRLSAVWKLASLALFFGAWEIAGRSGFNFAFPSFSETFLALVELLADARWALPTSRRWSRWRSAWCSRSASASAPAWRWACAGTWSGSAFRSSIVMQAAPMAALIPLVTFVYGIGLTAKVLAVVILAMPVIAINSYKAVRNVPPSLVSMCRSFMGSRRQVLLRVVLPAASPMMFAGIRLGVAEGFSGVVLAELPDHADRDRRPDHVLSLDRQVSPTCTPRSRRSCCSP